MIEPKQFFFGSFCRILHYPKNVIITAANVLEILEILEIASLKAVQ